MSKHQDRIIHIVVIGVSGPESLRGAVGVGKSALCNRFVRPLADEYQPDDHISTISQSDFSGRVINNDHFLYWGNVTKRNEDGAEVHFSIIEQTEFVDDQSFAPLRGSNTQPYHKRCAVTKLTSAEKLMYICKYQLGEEDGYDKVVLPEPKFSVDGYILVFDVNSKVRGRPVQKQLEFLGILQQAIQKTKKPTLVVATKCDEADEHYLKEARGFATKIKANIVETSAHEAVNVDLAFMTLAQLIDRTKGRPKEVPFSEAIKSRKELLDRITDAYSHLLRRDVVDYHTLWKSKSKQYQKTSQPYLAYVKHLGTQSAKKLFERHRKKLKEEHLRKKQLQYLTTLPKALEDIFPDLYTIGERTWEDCKVNLNEHPQFQQWFIMLDEEWKFSPYIDSMNPQIPYDFLDTNNEECKNVFKKHVDALVAAKRKARMKAEFKKLLSALKEVVIPGRKIEDIYTHLADEESFRELTDGERKDIYDAHQDEIKKRSTNDFMEMLYEKAELFERFENMDRGNYVEEAREVEEALQGERRYQALSELKNERKVMLYKHIAFMHNPTKDTCPSRDKCMDKLIQSCIEYSAPKSPVKDPVNKWSTTNGKLNVVLLGEDGLADELANEIRQQSCDDDYTLDGALHSLDLRPIEGDVSQPRNHLATDNFSPQGCICTFTSPLSFQYVKTCLEKTLLATNNDERHATLRNIPVVLMFARDVSVPDSDLWHLKEDATKLQERLNQCVMIEMPTEERIIWHGKKFHESQIQKAFRFIVTTKKLSEGLDNMDGIDEDEPDLRIGMALMCGDQLMPDLVLGPLLGHDTCFQTPDLEQSITLDLFLGTERKKIDVDVMSYHQSTLYREDIHHGYILVYSTKRKASFETMKNFLDSENVENVPTLIVGVLDMDKSPDYETQVLRLEGHNLAESKDNCKFLPAGPAIQGQPLAYSVFLKEVYDRRIETEEMYEYVGGDTSTLDNRFPARTPSLSEEDNLYALPQQTYRTPEKPRLPGYDSENTYDTFSRPTPYGRTPIPTAPKGSPYGQINKPATLPRRHSDLGEHPLEELYATPDKPRFRTSTGVQDTVEGPQDKYKEMYARVDKSHKRNSSMEPVSLGPHGDNGEGELYAKVDKFRKTPTSGPSSRIVPPGENNEGWADCSVYESAGHQRRSLPPDDTNALYAVVPRGGGDGEESGMMRNPIYDSVEQQPKKKPPPPVKPKPQRQRIRGKTPSTGDSPNDGDLHTPPGLNKKGKNKPKVPPRSSIKSPPNLPDNALINELRGVIGEDTTPRRSFGEDPTRHTSSDSDSRSSMDAIAREPSKRKKSYRRKKTPKTRVTQFEYEPGMEYTPAERIYEPIPQSPIIDESSHQHEVKKQSKEERARQKKEEKQRKKELERRNRQQAKLKKHQKNRKPTAPPIPQKPKGPPIETLVKAGVIIPPFVVICLEYIEKEGLRTEGVYRVPGKGVDSDALISKFDEEGNVDIAEMEISVHAVATAVKQFFSQLPEPLVPRTTQEEFLNQFKVVGSENFRSALPELMNKLPEVNRNVFSYMMLHLNRIMQQADMNKMTAENLSTCWWPTLLQPQYKSLEDMANHAPLQNVVITCMQDAPELFGDMEFFPPPEVEDDPMANPESDFPEAPAESDTSMTTPIEE